MSNISYVWIFLAAVMISVLLTPMARRLALRYDVLDRPTGSKQHTSAMPYLGGLALVLAVLGAAGTYAIIRPPASSLGELGVVMALALVVAGVGFRDDVRSLSPIVRLVIETAAAAGLWMVDVRIGLFGHDLLNFLATVIWVVGLTNAQNLLDNVDGLAAGVAAVAAGWVLVIAAANGQFLVASLAAGVMGCAVGFLWHNFHPAKIYMGDGGSLFLGFLLAYLTIKLRFGGRMSSPVITATLLMGVPIFDTALVTINRLRHRRSPLLGGTDHVSHRLLHKGMSVPAAVVVIAAFGAALGAAALLVSRIDPAQGYIVAAIVSAMALAAGIWLSLVPVYENRPLVEPEGHTS